METKCREIIDYRFVKVELMDGTIIEGCPISLEYADETERGIDNIGIQVDDKTVIGIWEDEIKKWKA